MERNNRLDSIKAEIMKSSCIAVYGSNEIACETVVDLASRFKDKKVVLVTSEREILVQHGFPEKLQKIVNFYE